MKKIYLSIVILFVFSAHLFSQCNVNGFATSVSCSGTCDGSINTFVFGGTPPYKYVWSNGDTTANITNLCAATYTVTVTDAGTCNSTHTYTVNPAATLSITITTVNEVCHGDSAGSATANVTGGSFPYTYVWSTVPVQNGRTARNLVAGTYTVSITDGRGCTGTALASITQPAQLTDSISSTNSLCTSPTGSASVTVHGGTTPYSYTWNTIPQQLTPSITSIPSGAYTVTIRDSAGCTLSSTVTVKNSDNLTATVTQVNLTCNGGSNATATLFPSGGSTPYTYLWEPSGQTTAMATGLSAGNDVGTVTDGSGCSFTVHISITQPLTAMTLNGNVTSVSCNGNCDGRITTRVTGGAFPYRFVWSNGDTTGIITNLCAATYTVTVTDAGGCTASGAYTVNAGGSLNVTATSTNEPCYGETLATATATVTGGTFPYSYSWSTLPVQNTRTARNLAVGTYTVSVTDSRGCSGTDTVSVTQPAQLLDSISSTTSACDSATGSVLITLSGGSAPYNYRWNTTPVSTTASVTGLLSGVYTVNVRDSRGCTVSATVTVGNASGLSATVTSTNISCFGDSTGTATATGVGGKTPYTYSWNTIPVQTTMTAVNLRAGNYIGTVTDSSGCSFSVKVTITQPPVFRVLAGHTNISCFGDTNGTATALVMGGIPPFTYSWSTTPVQATRMATGLLAGTYTVTVSDSNGCSVTATATITGPATPLTVSVTHTDVTCYGAGNGTATAIGSGGTQPYNYRWSVGGFGFGGTVRNLGAGTYTVIVTDRGGCSVMDSVTISRPPQIVIATNAVAADCGVSDGSASATVTSGGHSPFTYQWQPAGGTNAIATGLPAGVYTIRVTDSTGCVSTAVADIPNTGAGTASISSSKNVSCRGGNDGSATVTITGGVAPYTYMWNTLPPQTGATATGLRAGTYGVSVRDSNGCISTVSVTITQPATRVFATITQTNDACNGDSSGTATANATGGTAPYTYSWNTVPVQTTKTAVNLKAGFYSVTITDSVGCAVTNNVFINQPPPMTLTTTKINATCYGTNNGSASVSITGGAGPFTYSWSSTPVQTTRTAINLPAGTYTVTVTAFSGCTETSTAVITQPAQIVLSTSTINTSCGGSNGSAIVKVTSGGTSPFTYSWNTTPVQTNDTASGLSANSYSVIVTDYRGCSATASTIVLSTNAGTASVTVNNVTCYGQSNGSASVTLTGGTPPYTYVWATTPIQLTDTATGLTAGTYAVVVTDHSGCQAAANAVIGQPNSISAVITVTNVACFGGATGMASANVSGGNGGYTYSWNTMPVQTASEATGLKSGSYTATVTDSKGCTSTALAVVTGPEQALNVVASQTRAACIGGNNGIAMATVTGGTPSYSYLWNTGATTDTVGGLGSGIYSVTVTDLAGCTGSSSVSIAASPAMTLVTEPVNVSCFGYANGSDSVRVTGGSSPYGYLWNSVPSQNTAYATALLAGVYTITVTDLNGCSSAKTDTIKQPAAPVSLTLARVEASCDSTNGMAWVVVTGGTLPYTYSWNSSPVQTTDTATGLPAGNYQVTVTDAKGCSNSGGILIDNSGVGRDTITAVTNVTCFGGNNGSATVTVVGGGTGPFTFNWNTTPVQTGSTATNLGANTYLVTVTDSNGCKTSKNVFISQPPPITPITVTTGVRCHGGGATGKASVILSGGNPPYTIISWNSIPVQNTDTATGLAAGTYTVSVTDSKGCTGTATAVVVEPPAITVVTSSTAVLCHGGSDGTATVNPAGGIPPYDFTWSTTPAQNGSTANGLSAGTYSVTVTDTNGCSLTAVDTVTEPGIIDLSITSTNTTSCGTANGTATVHVDSGGVSPFTYLWSTGATTAIDSNLAADFYSVVVTDANNCMDSTTVSINTTIGAGTATFIYTMDSCYGETIGSATVIMHGGTPPFTYEWITSPRQTTVTAIGLGAGSYAIVIHDSSGCVTVANAVITSPSAITVEKTKVNATCLTCADGLATITPSGGVPPYAYSWVTTPVQDSATATGLLPGVYSFCVTDAFNCQVCDTVTVNVTLVGVLNLSLQSATKMIVYPNPSSGQFTMEFEDALAHDLSVRIVNMMGQEIYTEKISQSGKVSRTYNLSNYPKGMYLIQVISNEKVYNGRIILE